MYHQNDSEIIHTGLLGRKGPGNAIHDVIRVAVAAKEQIATILAQLWFQSLQVVFLKPEISSDHTDSEVRLVTGCVPSVLHGI